jgi:hypothetical protein
MTKRKFKLFAGFISGLFLISILAFGVYSFFKDEAESGPVVIDIGKIDYARQYITARPDTNLAPGTTQLFGFQIIHKNSGTRDLICQLNLEYSLEKQNYRDEVTGFYARMDMNKLKADGRDTSDILSQYPDDYEEINGVVYLKEKRFDELFFLVMDENDEWIKHPTEQKYYARVAAGGAVADLDKYLSVASELGGKSSSPSGLSPQREFEDSIILSYNQPATAVPAKENSFKTAFGVEAYDTVNAFHSDWFNR